MKLSPSSPAVQQFIRFNRSAGISFLLALLFAATPLKADVRLPAIISDHMVLQKSNRTALWGWAEPNEKVRVALAGKTAETTAGQDGKWRVVLDLSAIAPDPTAPAVPGSGSYKLTIEGHNTIEISDVVIGEVWVASGQSNMEFPLAESVGVEDELQPGRFTPQQREFRVPKIERDTPQEDCRWNKPWGAKWVVADPKTSAGFSAIGYFFGRQLVDQLHTPVGIINTPYSGTPIEAWISQETLESDAELKEGAEKCRAAYVDFPDRKDTFIREATAWIDATGRHDPGTPDPLPYTEAPVTGADWHTIRLPGAIAASVQSQMPALVPNGGVVWLRREIILPLEKTGKATRLELGDVRGFDTVYLNGKKVAQITCATYPGDGFPQRYDIPAGDLKEGANIVAVRIYSPLGQPKVLGGDYLKLGDQQLTGDWLARTEVAFPPLPANAPPVPATLNQRQSPQYVASYLFNGMIHPILPYSIRGVVWYQGENNVGRAHQYRRTFPMLIQDWRARWGLGDLPFYFCQLANFRPRGTAPEASNWAELRDAQSQTLSLPHTGQAVLIDTGESENIHPKDKRTAGLRLAALALARTYGKDVVSSGPAYQAMKIEGNTVILSFTHADGGLVARPLADTFLVNSLKGNVPPKTAPLVRNSPGSELQGFAICGADRKWTWAQARIEDGKVKVWATTIPSPVAVRYAWADNPTCNLYNGAGLPSSPFRTDDLSDSTLRAKF